MKWSMISALSVGVLLSATVAFSAPKVLSSSALDSVSAGTGSEIVGALADTDIKVEDLAVALDGGPATVGDFNDYYCADASVDGIATSGIDNFVADEGNLAFAESGVVVAGSDNRAVGVDQSDALIAISTGDNTEFTIVTNLVILSEITDGSAVIVGCDNTADITRDDTDIDGEIEEDSSGVIAKYAEIANSFNYKRVTTDVDVDIEDSFNTVTNTLDISGQETLNAIINANALFDQAIATNLNATTATSCNSTEPVEGDFVDGALDPTVAVATTAAVQAVVNNTLLVAPLPVIGPGIQ